MKHPEDKRSVVLTLGVMICISAFTVDVTVPILPLVAEGLKTDLRYAQLIISCYLIGYSIGQIPFGLCADRFGRLPVIYTGLLIFVGAGIVNVIAQDIYTLLICRFLQGLGGAMAPVLARAVARDISSGHRTIVLMSILATALGISVLLSPIIGSFLGSTFGWRASILTSVILGVGIIIMVTTFLKETKPDTEVDDSIMQQLVDSARAFIHEPQCMWATAILSIAFGGYVTVLSSSAPILQDIYGISVAATGAVFSLAIVPFFLAATFSKWLSARIGLENLMRLTVAVFGFASLMFLPMIWWQTVPFVYLWSGVAVYMLGIGFAIPSASSLVMQPLPKSAGFASSILGTAQVATGAIVSAIASIMYDGTIKGLVWILFVAGVLIVVVFFLRYNPLRFER